MPVNDAQAEWVFRVLGVRAAPAAVDLPRLRAEVAALVAQIPPAGSGDPEQREAVTALARSAAAALKDEDPAAAARAVDRLRTALAAKQPGRAAGGTPARTLPIWQAARDLTQEQIGALQDALRQTKHPLFLRIADQGLNGFTGTFLVGLQAALMDADATTGEARATAVAKARAAAGRMRDFLEGHRIVPLLEANPVGAPVTLRRTLLPALDSIERTLGQ